MNPVTIGASDDWLDRRERLLAAKRERTMAANANIHLMNGLQAAAQQFLNDKANKS